MPENNSILEKLDGLESRYEEVSTLITDPSVISDQERYVKLTREYKDLGDIMDARKRYIDCLNAIKEAKDILANESDPEMKDMAREELVLNEDLQPRLEEEIKIALVPKDPEDAKNVQMEIRAGTGGDEACLFAGDLFQMYKRFCDSKGWTLSITSVSEGAVGGFKEIDFAVSGDNVYGTMKYESGVHRVQRVGGESYTVVCDAALGEVVRPDFCTSVAGGYERLAAVGYVVHIFLVLLVVNECSQARQGTLLVLGLVACLGTFYEYFLGLARVGILPHVAQTYARLDLVHVLSAGARTAECVPFNLAFVYAHFKLVGFGQYGHCGRRCLHAAVRFRHRHALHAVYA